MNIRARRFSYDLAIVASVIVSAAVVCRLLFFPKTAQADIQGLPTNQQPSVSAVNLEALKSIQVPYEPALELRENAECLLTPAILIQQSIKSNEVILYPND
jgi:hypothetical protein